MNIPLPVETANTPLPVETFIKTKCIFHTKAKYNKQRYAFDMEQCRDKTPGVYFICVNVDGNLHIQKVGKGEGVSGLYQRIAQYIASGVNRVNGTHGKHENRYDRSVITMHLAMEKVFETYGNDVELLFYIYPFPKEDKLHKDSGYILESSQVRALELKLSKQAKKEGHPMLLSGQD
jgi:hypothetical protein